MRIFRALLVVVVAVVVVQQVYHDLSETCEVRMFGFLQREVQ